MNDRKHSKTAFWFLPFPRYMSRISLFLPSNMNTMAGFIQRNKKTRKKKERNVKAHYWIELMTYHIYFSFFPRIFIFINDFLCISSQEIVTILT
jgi:hypothetical protein